MFHSLLLIGLGPDIGTYRNRCHIIAYLQAIPAPQISYILVYHLREWRAILLPLVSINKAI